MAPILSARTTLFQEKSMCQISFDLKFGNSLDMKEMGVRIFVAIFKANNTRAEHRNSGIY